MNTEEKVKRIVTEVLGINLEDVRADSHLITDLGADSIDLIEMAMSLEENFGIRVDDDDLDNIHTFGEVVQFVMDREP